MSTNIHPDLLFRSSGSKLLYEKGVFINSMKKVFLKSLQNSHGNIRVGTFFCKTASWSTYIKKRLRHSCFPVTFGKFLVITCLQNAHERLILNIIPANNHMFKLTLEQGEQGVKQVQAFKWFKVNNKDTRSTQLASFWCLYS